jgi:hypothetical protein
MQAETAAAKTIQFFREIESQVGWTTQLPWSADTINQRRYDGLRLLRQVPAITEITQLDSSGIEQLKISRRAMDAVASMGDFSKDPKFSEAMAKGVYYGPLYFLNYGGRLPPLRMILSLAGTRRDAGVTVVEVGLELIWEVVTRMKVGEHGVAYILDAQGRVIVHPNISLVERNADFSSLAHVQAARAAGSGAQVAQDINGREVITAYAAIAPLGWQVFVELPTDDADAPAR